MTEFWSNGNYVTALGGVLVFIGTGLAVWGVFKTNEESSQKDQQIIDLSEEFAAYATGGDSFIYLEVDGFGTPEAKTKIIHEGKYPVRDVEMLIFDVSSQMPQAKSGELAIFDLSEKYGERNLTVFHPSWSKEFSQFPFEPNPTGDYYAYFVNIDAHNGAHRQILELQLIDGVWRQAYRVQRGSSENRETRILKIDPEFVLAQPEIRQLLENLPDRDQSVPTGTSNK